MFGRKVCIGQRLFHAVPNLLRSPFQFQRTEFCHHSFCFLASRLFILLSMDRLEHFCSQFYLGLRHNREDIAVKVHYTALVLGFWEYFTYSLQRTLALVPNDEINAVQTARSASFI